MISLEDATLKAVFDTLTAGVTLAPVASSLTEGTQPPLVLLGDITFEDVGGKDGRFLAASFSVLSIVAGASRRVAHDLMLEVETALVDASLLYEGAQFSRPSMPSSDVRVEAEAGVAMGTQSFSVFVQPAD